MVRLQFSLRTLLALSISTGVALGTYAWWLPWLMNLPTAFTPVEQRPIPWQDYSPEALAQAQQDGKPVLINFDAEWDLITVYNRTNAFERSAVRRLIADYDVAPLHGDCTHQDNEASQALKDYCNYVPCTVIVDPRSPERPIVHGGIIRETTVINGLQNAIRFRSGPPLWDPIQSPWVGLAGAILLIGLAHLLARNKTRQAAGVSEGSATSSVSVSSASVSSSANN